MANSTAVGLREETPAEAAAAAGWPAQLEAYRLERQQQREQQSSSASTRR